MSVEQQRRVLVVDDEPLVRGLLVSVLRSRGLTADEATDGNEAVALLRQNRYAVILLDLLMPIADGFSVLEAMRVDESLAPPVVLVITGADHRDVEQLDARSIHGIVRKPFDPEEIGAVVAACAELRARSVFETMALTTMVTGAPLLALLSSRLSS